jgi:type II secretory pathway pseudopilin PulG
MVVISIIAMLSSIILAGTTSIKAAARDSVRTQEVRQIDMAVQSYALSTGHPPYLGENNCQPSASTSLDSESVKNCTALSTAEPNSAQSQAWTKFIQDIQPYISANNIPADPCGGSCTSSSGLPLGYTYVAPAAVMYSCYQSNTCSQLNTDPLYWYQLYAALEKNTYFMGSGSGGGAFYSPNASVPVITLQRSYISSTNSWTVDGNIGGSYQQCSVTSSIPPSWPLTLHPPNTGFTISIYDPFIGRGVVDTITAVCTNYGAANTNSISITGH